MTENYLKTARANATSDHKTSELEFIETREDFKEVFAEMQALRKKINDEKIQACNDIDAKYKAEVQDIESNYGMMLSLTR